MIDEHEHAPAGVDTSDIRPHDQNWVLMNKYRMKRFPGKKVTLPGGIAIDAMRFAGVKPPGADASFVLHSPELILKNPRPDCKYAWRIRADEETFGLVETGCIRPVRMDEIDRTDRRTAKILGYIGPGGATFVGWKRHGLFEVAPVETYEWYRAPEEYGIAKMANLGAQFEHEVEEYTQGKMQGEFTAKDTRPAGKDAGARPRRM